MRDFFWKSWSDLKAAVGVITPVIDIHTVGEMAPGGLFRNNAIRSHRPEGKWMPYQVGISRGITVIPERAFYNCLGLHKVVFPDGLTTIASQAFFLCTDLTDVQIPDSVASIADYAFKYCFGLRRIELPDSLENVGENIFEGCIALESIVLPANEALAKKIWDQLPAAARRVCLAAYTAKIRMTENSRLAFLLSAQHRSSPAFMYSAFYGNRGLCLRVFDCFEVSREKIQNTPWKLFQRKDAAQAKIAQDAETTIREGAEAAGLGF